MMMKIWFLNYAKTEFRKHLNNKANTFDFRYWCWLCWRSKCCKKFVTWLYKSNFWISHMNVESNISISRNVDINFAISITFFWIRRWRKFCNRCLIFKISIFAISKSVRFWISEHCIVDIAKIEKNDRFAEKWIRISKDFSIKMMM